MRYEFMGNDWDGDGFTNLGKVQPMRAPSRKTSTRRKASMHARAGDEILWARRRLERDSQERLRRIATEIVLKAGYGNVKAMYKGLGVSALTSAMGISIAHRYYSGENSHEKIKNYERALKQAVKNQEGADEPLFVQLGGAIILDAIRGSHGRRQIAMEVISGAQEVLDDKIGLVQALTPPSMSSKIINRLHIPHVSVIYADSLATATHMRDCLNESEAVAMWVGLSELKAIRADHP